MPTDICIRCRRRRPCNHAGTPRATCKTCTPRRAVPCAHCGQSRPPSVRRPEGPVCDPCYTAALRRRGPCARCGTERRLVSPPGPAATTCADCAGLPAGPRCRDCAREDKLYERGRCAPCSLRRRSHDVLRAGASARPRPPVGVHEAICASPTPRSALNWLRNGATAALLADLAAGRLDRSHQALDAHPGPRGRQLPAAAARHPPRAARPRRGPRPGRTAHHRRRRRRSPGRAPAPRPRLRHLARPAPTPPPGRAGPAGRTPPPPSRKPRSAPPSRS